MPRDSTRDVIQSGSFVARVIHLRRYRRHLYRSSNATINGGIFPGSKPFNSGRAVSDLSVPLFRAKLTHSRQRQLSRLSLTVTTDGIGTITASQSARECIEVLTAQKAVRVPSPNVAENKNAPEPNTFDKNSEKQRSGSLSDPGWRTENT